MQQGRIYYTTPASINTPDAGTLTLFQSSVDNLFYVMDENRVLTEVGSGSSPSGYLLGNINVPIGTSPILSSLEASLMAIQIDLDLIMNTVSYPNLVSLTIGIAILDTVLTDFSIPTLVGNVPVVFLEANPILTNISLQGIVSSTNIKIDNNQALATIDLSGITDVTGVFHIFTNQLLTDISFTSLGTCVNITLQENALNVGTVDGILADRAAIGPVIGFPQLFLDGGTNSAPTDGILNADYIQCLANGWNVIINP